MAFLTAIINKITGQDSSKRVGIGNVGSVILVDATLADTVNFEAELTSHPVEKGLDVTDHILIKPKRIEIEGVVSEAPIQLKDAYSEKGLLDQATDAIGAVAGAVTSKFTKSPILQGAAATIGGVISNKLFSASQSPAQQTKDALIQLLEGKTPINIQIAKKNFPDMVLINLSFPRDPGLGQAMRFKASFQEIRRIESQEISIGSVKIDVKHTAGAEQSLGNQNLKPSDAPTSERASGLYRLGRGAGFIKEG